MTNPFDPAYLTTASPFFGPLAWIFFLLQIAGFGIGIYLVFLRRDSNAVREHALRRLGIIALGLGGIGMLVGALRLNNVGIFTQRFWFYLVLALELAAAAYAFYYARMIYPRELANSQTSRGKASRPSTQRAGTAQSGKAAGQLPQEETSEARGGRRAARKQRKRKQR
jgi:hypothetical protein